jgi:hypothetical protein
MVYHMTIGLFLFQMNCFWSFRFAWSLYPCHPNNFAMKRILLFGLVLFTFPYIAVAQVSVGGEPLSFSIPILKDVTPPSVRVYGFNPEEVAAEDALQDQLGDKAPRFAKLLPAGFNLQNSGEWTNLKNGDRVWRLRLETAQAQAVTLYYDEFSIPQGGRLFIYNDDKSHYIGAFTAVNNEDGGSYATQLVYGSAVTLEYFEPGHATGQGVLNIAHLGHAYRYVLEDEVYDEGQNDRGGEACEVDVNCTPEGSNWQDEKRGVVRMQVVDAQGAGWCTASMVNNTAQNCRNFMLSALHCGDNSTANHFGQYIFYFNYERPGCGTGTAPTSQSMTGCVKRAESNDGGGSTGSDFLLLELNSNPPANYNVYYNGWNKQNTASSSGVGIHHPAGGRKKVSTYTSALTTTAWGSATGSHWRVVWAATANGHGVTEGGSSGSPLFNSSGLIVGTLTGGGSFCNTPTQPDSYGKMSYHWSSNPGDDLSTWLDPTNSGVNSLNGTYAPCTVVSTLDAGIAAVTAPAGATCATSVTPIVTLQNFGSTTITSVQIQFNVDGSNQQTYSWTGSLGASQTTTVNLPTMTVAAGTHVFNASTNLPNGQSDQNASNNASSSNFTIVNADTYVTLRLTTDNYGAETTWQVAQNGGGVVASGGPYTSGASALIVQDICVLSGQCYTFTISDSESDGICCQYGTGSYSLGDANGMSIYTGAAFTASETVNFCVPSGSASCDTIYDPFASASTGYVIYTNSGGGYIAGSNSFADKAKAQAFQAPSGAYEVVGVAYWVGAKQNGGGSIAVNLYDMDGAGVNLAGNTNNAPGTVLATRTIALSRVDTATFINYTPFNTPVTLSGAYAVGIDFSSFATGNQIGLVTNTDGNSGNAERSWEKWSDNTWHTIDQGWNSGSNGKFDLGIFPVLCPLNVTGLDAEELHSLMVYPNPSSGQLNVGFVLNTDENARLEVLSALGQLVYSKSVTGPFGSVTLDLQEQASGIYVIRLATAQGLVVRKWVKQD